MMKTRHLLKDRSPAYYGIAPDRTMAEAVDVMMKHAIGALIVMEDNRIRGIVTERDVMATVHRQGMNLANILVRDVMASNLVLCQADDSLDRVMELLFDNDTGHRIRHLPVMDNGRLAGIISIADIVHALLTETRFENRLLRSYIKNWPDPGD
jgi:CBS domain-containing protein